ncbi:molybdenum cofactor biosynthesis protein MoaE [uncultured Parasphingorhabdus sp.]|uniref:molybdenum cofactor biosynthesis protein MoaE n=1 Tax=uncultured Parasphingorhabdus sp. TaxID=2709694 RepID=UPI0030DC0009|tara:strand:+ start:45370 stop:45813 length:444 start_codon:yes stop_codon:yes gene_type:complete
MIRVEVGTADFDIGAETAKVAAQGGGAIASFVGQVRNDGNLETLELEHYPAMTDKALRNIAKTAQADWPLHAITIIHRVGKLSVGENIVLVVTGSDHREAAIESCSFIMDRLKTVAPFWKKETGSDGSTKWIEERESDLKASEKWQK